jgi:CubicO group peptidase (beta-lactamase class C family)
VIRDGEIAYCKGYGFADIDSKSIVTERTVFNWASNSKPLIATAALQLVQSRRLTLDSPIRGYLPDLPGHLQPLTTRQLLCHQSGIPHYANGKIVPTGAIVKPSDELDPVVAIHRFANSPLIFEPGTKIDYSTYAYVLLSAVVQAAGKQPLERQLGERIVKPLGMTSFQLDLPLRDQRDWTKAYHIADGLPRGINDYAHYWKHGGGGYKSNVRDFAKFAVALMTQALLDEQATRQMWTPQKLIGGGATRYGLGVVVSGSAAALKISHNGSQDETRTRMVIYPRQRHGIVVMCNTQTADPAKISTAVYSAINP